MSAITTFLALCTLAVSVHGILPGGTRGVVSDPVEEVVVPGTPTPAPHDHDDDPYGHRSLIDLTVSLKAGLPTWASKTGLEHDFKVLVADMSKGDAFYATKFSLGAHTGTHIDAPGHFLADEYKKGNSVAQIDLETLIGHALVMHVPSDTNITAEVLQGLQIPHDVERLLLRTSNSDRGLLNKTEFVSDYVALTTDGAKYLADHTNVKLVGIDYLSIVTWDDLAPGHVALLKKGIIPVEGLDLSSLSANRWYHLTCLPLKLEGAEGAPARCVAIGPDTEHELYRDARDNNPMGAFGGDWAGSMMGGFGEPEVFEADPAAYEVNVDVDGHYHHDGEL